MAKHTHLLFDWETGELFGIALPTDVPSTGLGAAEQTGPLAGTVDGSNRVFEFPAPVIAQGFPGVNPTIIHNGRIVHPDHVEIFESVAASGNFDRVRFIVFAPRRGRPWAKYTLA